MFRPAWLEDTETVTDQPHEVLDVANGRIAVLRRDELFVEFVEVYEVVGGAHITTRASRPPPPPSPSSGRS